MPDTLPSVALVQSAANILRGQLSAVLSVCVCVCVCHALCHTHTPFSVCVNTTDSVPSLLQAHTHTHISISKCTAQAILFYPHNRPLSCCLLPNHLSFSIMPHHWPHTLFLFATHYLPHCLPHCLPHHLPHYLPHVCGWDVICPAWRVPNSVLV